MIKEILIGAKIYTVEYVDDLGDVQNDEQTMLAAQVDLVQSKIEVSKSLGEGSVIHAIMHEIYHAILCDNGFEKLSDNERLVDNLAQTSIQLLRQNPQLLKEILNTGNFQFSYKDNSFLDYNNFIIKDYENTMKPLENCNFSLKSCNTEVTENGK